MFSANATTTVDIVPVNDPAFLNFQSRSLIFNEATRNEVFLFEPGDTITDSDGITLEWISLEIISPVDSYDAFAVNIGTSNLVVDYRSASEGERRLLNISGTADNATYVEVLQTVSFVNVFPGLELANRLVEVTTYDGETESPPHSITIIIQPFDDPPMCFFGEWVCIPLQN